LPGAWNEAAQDFAGSGLMPPEKREWVTMAAHGQLFNVCNNPVIEPGCGCSWFHPVMVARPANK
jgi:hypothetical protein